MNRQPSACTRRGRRGINVLTAPLVVPPATRAQTVATSPGAIYKGLAFAFVATYWSSRVTSSSLWPSGLVKYAETPSLPSLPRVLLLGGAGTLGGGFFLDRA